MLFNKKIRRTQLMDDQSPRRGRSKIKKWFPWGFLLAAIVVIFMWASSDTQSGFHFMFGGSSLKSTDDRVNVLLSWG
jgi:hypothetical protein